MTDAGDRCGLRPDREGNLWVATIGQGVLTALAQAGAIHLTLLGVVD